MTLRSILYSSALLALVACGGGGGGSNPPAIPPATPPSGGGSGGGTTGGTVIPGGLVSGGVSLVVDTSVVGVQIDVAVGGTGLVAGDIQDFGSVIANGITTNTDNAEFVVEGESANQSDLRQGQQILIVGDSASNTATQVLYRANVKGEVTTVLVEDVLLGRATYTVMGQTVTTDATTTFSNVNVGGVTVGSLLEVSGTVEPDGSIAASFIELESTLAEFKVMGQVSGLTATEFTLGGLTVDFSTATLSDFDTGVIADADVVEVRGAPGDFSAPAQFSASEVERLPVLTVGGDAVVRIEGFIDRFESSTDFDVQTTPITTNTSTVFSNGDAESLALAVKVQVEGVADGDGAILAQSVTVQPTAAIRVEGGIENIAGQTVTALGITFAIRELTELEDERTGGLDPLTLADLVVGDEVEVRGYLDGSGIVATSLELEDAENRSRLRGAVTALDETNGTLDIFDIEITGQSGITEFEDTQENPIAQAEFYNLVEIGATVTVRWDVFSSTSAVADVISLEEPED